VEAEKSPDVIAAEAEAAKAARAAAESGKAAPPADAAAVSEVTLEAD
jgi:hypothetical protein